VKEFRLKENPGSFEEFSKLFIPRVDGFIEGYYREKIKSSPLKFVTDMYEMLKEYCTREGKRVRPMVLLAAYSGYKARPGDYSHIIRLASVVEMMHSFLLIQDDIIDESDIRRGGKALHVAAEEKYSGYTFNKSIGSDIAIVLADVIMSNAIEIIAGAEIKPAVRKKFLQVFSMTYEMTAWGQILDTLHSLPRRADFSQDVPMQIISMKTAYYTFYYPLLMGYILSGRDDRVERENIRNFALPLGSAFQIRDDIIGVFGKVEKTGKPNDSDILEGKMTILVQKTIEKLKGEEKKRYRSLITAQRKRKADVNSIRKMIIESGGLDASLSLHRKFIDESLENLEKLTLRKSYKRIFAGIIQRVNEIDMEL
jgi:geranylgeranyl diphosphate synthase, type I